MPRRSSPTGPSLFDAAAEPAPPPETNLLRDGAVWRYRAPADQKPPPGGELVEVLATFGASVCFVRVGGSRLAQTTLAVDDFLRRAAPEDLP